MSETHHEFSPSRLDIWAECPRFDGKDGEENEAMAEGARLHDQAARLLRNEAVPDTEVDEGVAWYVGYVKATCDVEVEQRVEYVGDDFAPVYFGTADACSATDVFDLKSDREPMPHRTQLMAYALALMQRNGTENMTCHVCYCRARTVDKFAVTRAEAYEAVMSTIAARASADGEKACRYCGWCANLETCPAVVGMVKATAQGYGDLALDSWHPSEITQPAQMARALDAAKVLEAWCESVKHHAQDMAIKHGQEIPGYTVRSRGGARVITDIAAAHAASGLDAADFLRACDVSLTDLEKIVAAKDGLSAAAAKKEVARRLEGLVVQKPASCYLQRASVKKE